MVLSGLKLIDSNVVMNIRVSGSLITSVSAEPAAGDDVQLNFDNALAFPGLINSHDHLDFNLFPQLGYQVYQDYVEWGNSIHQIYQQQIDRVLKVPAALRAQWGVYKNLLCGVTTVADHSEQQSIANPLITILGACQNLHSVRLEKNWKLRLNNPLKIKLPVVIHIGEGSGPESEKEIDKLIAWNLLRRDIIGVHGVAMSVQQAKYFKALVWCPETNYFLLNKTAAIHQLKNKVPILFGTDSTLTANWDIWDHIRMARKTALLTDQELYQALTIKAAKVWKLNSGQIAPGKKADMVVVKQKAHTDGFSSFFGIKPEDILIVMHKGHIRLFDEALHQQITSIDAGTFSKIYVNGCCKYVQGNLPELICNILHYYPEAHIPVQSSMGLTAKISV